MSLVDTFAVRLAEMSMKILDKTLVAAKADLVVHTPFKTLKETLTQVRSEALFDRVANRVWPS